MTDERFGFPPRREGPQANEGEGSGVRRVPVYDRRTIRPEDLTQPVSRPAEPEQPQATSQEAAQAQGRAPGHDAASQAGGPVGQAASGDAEEVEILFEEGGEGSGDSGLQEELRLANEKAAEHLGDLQRVQAEFANYRKRVLREQTELVDRAAGHLVQRLLGVLDSFELAVAAAEETKDFERMLRGVEMVLGELKEVLANEGLEAIPARDLPFDPNLHEAALEVPGDEDGEMVVAGVLRTGYILKGRILRPAMVKVTRRAPGRPHDGGTSSEAAPASGKGGTVES